ncbi:hypothetical protein K0M31_012730 [Melipona bicolor]|uniref:Uncharacterized protein n=1 Tax=Melipona bicolor TaxID=60889 RepID=A0AA40KH19_9HYME|nr:hypothetical protein K0M31_012730 [Melipona bicolor]
MNVTYFISVVSYILKRPVNVLVKKTITSSQTLNQRTKNMVETTCAKQLTDRQTQFGNARILDLSECIFVFKGSQSDYEEPSSDEEVSDFPIISILHLYCVICLNLCMH